MALKTEPSRVSPSTYKDAEGNWITLAAVDANTLYPRPATKQEIDAAKNPSAEPDAGLAKPDSTTRVSGAALPPASNADSLASLKATVDEINIREARKKDEEERYAKWREQELRSVDKRPAKSEAPSL